VQSLKQKSPISVRTAKPGDRNGPAKLVAPARPQRAAQGSEIQDLHAHPVFTRGLLRHKLTIGAPHDPREHEADRVADRVLRMPAPSGPALPQTRAASTGASTVASPIVREALNSTGQPLDASTRAYMEPRFGRDFSHVRIHADANSARMADVINAEAFTVGHDIYFGSGKSQRQSPDSDRLLAHELAHVIQQSDMEPTVQPKLKITGDGMNVARAVALLNSGLQQYRVSIDKTGELAIYKAYVELPPNKQQQALADRLTNIIDDPKTVLVTISAGSETLVGSYATGDIDIADVESIGVSALIHELEEQHQKQASGMPYGSETSGAHGKGIEAEQDVKGAKRGAQKNISGSANPDGTINAVVEVPYTFPGNTLISTGTVKTMVLTIKNNNIESVVWK
jgi:hypothetical protein